MKRKFYTGKQKELERIAIFSNVKGILNSLSTETERYIDFFGYRLKTQSDRYDCFRTSGIVCKECGLEAEYLALEKFPCNESYHFNLYGTDSNGEEMLFTKDHIIPKSKGGANHISNYRTLCALCNFTKGDQLLEDTTQLQEVV